MGVEDPVLVDLLSAHPQQRWDELIGRALTVGARGLVTMGLGIDLAELDAKVRRAVEEVTERAQACALELVDAGRKALEQELDPERRSSLIYKALSQFQEARDELLQGLDPGLSDSQASRMISELETLLGPGGDLERRLAEALDPDADGSRIRRFADSIETRIAELRDVLMKDRGRALEAERGTAKGIEFEDEVERSLRRIAERIGGCVVARVSRQPGSLGPEAFVGDLTLSLATGIAWSSRRRTSPASRSGAAAGYSPSSIGRRPTATLRLPSAFQRRTPFLRRSVPLPSMGIASSSSTTEKGSCSR